MQGIRLELLGLKKKFGYAEVLRGIDLDVEPGEFVAIVGKSGCGKSTLLRLISGLETPSAGSVLVNGQALSGLNQETRMMFQDARLLPWKRVLDNVGLGLKYGWQKRARQVLHQVGLAERAHDWPAVLSGGQRQRVALARALVAAPSLLLLDEPLGALDALTRIEMQRLIENLWQEQRFTALLITHDVEEAVAIADRVVLIENGKIVLNLPVALPRPRHRGSAVFASLKEEVLNRVMGQGVEVQPEFESEAAVPLWLH